jgi:hypothetical protein
MVSSISSRFVVDQIAAKRVHERQSQESYVESLVQGNKKKVHAGESMAGGLSDSRSLVLLSQRRDNSYD